MAPTGSDTLRGTWMYLRSIAASILRQLGAGWDQATQLIRGRLARSLALRACIVGASWLFGGQSPTLVRVAFDPEFKAIWLTLFSATGHP